MSSIRVGLILFAVLATSIFLSSCSALVGVGTAVGVAAVQERGVKGRATDLQIEAFILKDFLEVILKFITFFSFKSFNQFLYFLRSIHIAHKQCVISFNDD